MARDVVVGSSVAAAADWMESLRKDTLKISWTQHEALQGATKALQGASRRYKALQGTTGATVAQHYSDCWAPRANFFSARLPGPHPPG